MALGAPSLVAEDARILTAAWKATGESGKPPKAE
jgi:hypothetical protein